MSPDELVGSTMGEIEIIAEKICDENITGEANWTREILTGLGERGQSLEFWVGASPRFFPGADGGEQGFDLVWAQNGSPARDEDGNFLETLALVVESEWQPESYVVEDFRKLPEAPAMVRTMIYDLPTCHGDMTGELQSIIQSSNQRQPGDTYLLVASNEDKQTNCWWLEYTVVKVDNERNAVVAERHQGAKCCP